LHAVHIWLEADETEHANCKLCDARRVWIVPPHELVRVFKCIAIRLDGAGPGVVLPFSSFECCLRPRDGLLALSTLRRSRCLFLPTLGFAAPL
jgi:hypothetical protein